MTPHVPPAAVRIALFAGMAERAGRRELELPWTGGTVAELLSAVQTVCPAIAPLAARSAVAIGDRYAAATDPVAAGDRVAIIPPVSGG